MSRASDTTITRAATDLFRAGWSMRSIARLFGKPRGWVEDRLRVTLYRKGAR